MLVPIDWLKDYTDVNVNIDEFCDRMIMSGSNLETVDYIGEEVEKVVIGKIISVDAHPDADKLVVCQVEVGQEEPVQIVTGASNVFPGAYVPAALHGSKLPGGKKITKGKLRGVESNGMLCSPGELGLDDKVIPVVQKDGIFILNKEYKVGMDVMEALELKSPTVDFEITPNRPDCLSMVGMARETAATFGTELRYPDAECVGAGGSAADYIQVEIKAPELCKRYAARIVKNVKIEQSPWWLQRRLIAAGMRPINNIVDITNFVMLEYGQPIHAFDIRNVEGAKIIVDRATSGEKFITLDGNERKLTDEMLLIRDSEKGIAIAGVMGGLNSEIEDDTTTIIIESANFFGDSVRATSKKLGLRTEASGRFEKGIDPNLCGTAADRVCKLIEMLGAGTVISGIVDVYPAPAAPTTVAVRVDRINNILGINLDRKGMEDIFISLEMQISGSGNVINVTPPTVRLDLKEEIDFVEEVARIYGYDKMPMTTHKGNSEAKKPRTRTLKDMARDAMCAMGANEIQTYSFVSAKGVDNLQIEEDSWERAFVRIINPLGEENSVMRTILTPNMMEVLGRNFSRNNASVRAFEIGNTFTTSFTDENSLPEEQYSMVIGAYGKEESFLSLKGMVCELLEILGVTDVTFTAESEYAVYHPGRCARISVGDIELGIMGQIHPEVSDKYGINTSCYCCELLFDNVMEKANTEKAYKPLPKYPSTSRDIALLVDEDISVGSIIEAIKENAGNILEKTELFDVYRGKQIADGKKSAAFALTYRAADKTLTDEEVSVVHEKVLDTLRNKLNAILREI